jgi:hypothetical protein
MHACMAAIQGCDMFAWPCSLVHCRLAALWQLTSRCGAKVRHKRCLRLQSEWQVCRPAPFIHVAVHGSVYAWQA